jgi:D,D-heptose 1,7-bisphosphate phosphatase
MKKAIFLDKDGTLIQNVPYNIDLEKIHFLPGVLQGLRSLYEAGYVLNIVSNQSGIGKGFFTEIDIANVATYLDKQFSANGSKLNGFYYCPHIPQDNCLCRKPSPDLFYQSAISQHIDLQNSWMIGDILDDIEAGNRAGCKTILLNNQNETEWDLRPQREPEYIVGNFIEATNIILESEFFPANLW